MALWVWADDSIWFSELIVGAGVACIAATLVEFVQHQSASHIRIRAEWLGPALRLPWRVVCDTVIVYRALGRTLRTGKAPASRFEEVPVHARGDSAEAVTHRALIIGGSSVAPNTFALGIDPDRDVMVVHHLVPDRPGAGSQ